MLQAAMKICDFNYWFALIAQYLIYTQMESTEITRSESQAIVITLEILLLNIL